jgi:hypothetical protein
MVQKLQKLQELKSKPEEAIEIASAFVKRTLEILTSAQSAKSA